jgi:hypothetical protein
MLTSAEIRKNQEQIEQNHPHKGEENDNYGHSGHSQQMNETQNG